MGLDLGVVELLQRVLGEAFAFDGVGQRDSGYSLMPVSTVDQFIEFGQSLIEIVEATHTLGFLFPLFDGNFHGHALIPPELKCYLGPLCSG